jgi:hypothetical protein
MRLIGTSRLKLVRSLLNNTIGLSMIVITLHNAMLAYISVFHFDEALKCANLILETYH